MKARLSRPWIVAALVALALVGDASAFIPSRRPAAPFIPSFAAPESASRPESAPSFRAPPASRFRAPQGASVHQPPATLCRNDPVNNFDPLGLFALEVHVGITMAALDAMKSRLGVSEGDYRQLLRGAIEGSMYPDLQRRARVPPIPSLVPSAVTSPVLRYGPAVIDGLAWPGRQLHAAGEWGDEKTDAAQRWFGGLFWSDYPRLRMGVENWWKHGPSFLDRLMANGARYSDWSSDLHDTHFGPQSWQHGMGDSSMKATGVQGKLITESLTNLAAFNARLAQGNYYDAGFELGKSLHYLQDTYTPSHTERDPVAGQILAFYDFNVQSPTRHGEADRPGLNSAVFKTAVLQSQSLIGIFLKGNSDGVSGLFQLGPKVDIGLPGLRFRPEDNQISPLDLLRGNF